VVTVAAGIQGTLSNLTIRNGSAQNGGGIYSNGALTINQSTVIGNNVSVSCPNCYASGGGIYNDGSLTINNTTLSGNSALAGGGIIVGEYATATLQNSIVANSPSGGNCGGSITSNGYNMSSDSSCNFSKSGDRNNTDPMLGPLQNNGGPTQTMALLPGSLAIDAGNPSGCKDASGHLLTTDQRGMPRHDPEDTGGCDMGAYERQTD
jgi:predicted outer membrane repeat protein